MHDQAVKSNALFVGVTETWLHPGVMDAEVTHAFPGYSLYRADRAGVRQGGGVALLLREDLTGDVLATYTEKHPNRNGSVCELLVIKVYQLDTVICVLYRPPDTRIEEFTGVLQCLDTTLSSLASPTPSVVLMGDMNLPRSCVSWVRSEDGLLVPHVAGHRDTETAGGKQDRLQAQHLIDFCVKHSLQQEVDQVTHGAEILDLVFTNNCELVSSVGVESWEVFTDHKIVAVNTNYQYSKQETLQNRQYLCDMGRRYDSLNFHLAPWSEIKDELKQIDWIKMQELGESCPTSALTYFHTEVLTVLEKLVPAKKEIKKKGKPRVNRLRRCLWKKHSKAKKQFLASKSLHKLTESMQKMWLIQKQLEDDYTAVNNMEEDEAALRIKTNSKAFFSFARSRQKAKSKIGPFLDPTTGFPNPSPDFAAEALRKQYDSVFSPPRPAWSVTDPKEHFKVEDDEDSLNDFKFCPEDIERACSELQGASAAGPDGVPAIFLKTCRKELSKPLYIMWRSSLDSGKIPSELLLVLITPIHKGGSRAAPKNYRPVALTSHLIKVFERVLRRELVRHIERYDILPDGQHGSRALRSTLTQLLSHYDTILEGLEKGEGVDAVYLDFSKAFDKVETGVLLHKLKSAKVLGKVGCWLASFLNPGDRQQAVVVEGRLSSLSPVISGVPQGTVLGPVLFLLHIADIARRVSPMSRASSYVDDTRVSRSITNQVDCMALQEDLSTIYQWAEQVNMVFNSDKFECLRYWPRQHLKPDFPYRSPDGSEIEEKTHLRDLGVEMASDLTFTVHISNTVSAASRLVGWTLRTFRRRSRQVMLTIWKSLIQSKLDYTI